MKAFDGQENYMINPGDYCIARKNHLVRYTKLKDEDDAFKKIIITLDEPFFASKPDQQYIESVKNSYPKYME